MADIGPSSPEEVLREGAARAFQNASSYFKEAGVLQEEGSLGHALALLLWATEEFSKAEMLTVLVEGVREVPDWAAAGKWGYLRLTSPPRRMWHHRDKFWYFRNYLALAGLLTRKLGRSRARQYCGVEVYDAVPTSIEWLLMAREAGLYVDYHGEGVGWTSPLDLRQPMGFEVIEHVRAYGGWVRKALREGWSKRVDSILPEVKPILEGGP